MGGVSLIIVAAGRGERLGASIPKAFVALAGEPMLARTLRQCVKDVDFARVVVAVPATHVGEFGHIVATTGPWPMHIDAVVGGPERQESVRMCLDALGADDEEIVVVHDGVRPFVSSDLLKACIAKARTDGAAAAALPVRDTLKRGDATGLIAATVDRRRLWMVQTPQAFRVALLRDAHDRAAQTGFLGTDDAALVEWAGAPVYLVPGRPENIKITEPADLRHAERLVAFVRSA
jgi:2-C-methyl-D-erythritol 4-phosphate cytidylyltransferase